MFFKSFQFLLEPERIIKVKFFSMNNYVSQVLFQKLYKALVIKFFFIAPDYYEKKSHQIPSFVIKAQHEHAKVWFFFKCHFAV